MNKSTIVAGFCTLVVCGLVWGGTKVNSRPDVRPPNEEARPVAALPTGAEAILHPFPATIRDFDIVKIRILVPTRGSDADRSHPGQPTVEAVTAVQLDDGGTIAAGELVPEGAVVARGIVRNVGPGPIELRNFETDEVVRVEDGGMVVVAAGTSCSVSCGSSSYACCNIIQGTADCRCKTAPASCSAGGQGATSCSIAAL